MYRYLFLCSCVLLLLACTGAPASSPSSSAATIVPGIASASRLEDRSNIRTPPVAGEIAPDFSYTGARGETVTLQSLRGKLVILNFWATWCDPCRVEMPDLQRIADEYQNDVVVLGINKLEQPDMIVPFATELRVRFQLVANPAGDISERYGAKNIPLTYFIRPDGTIGERHLGILDYASIAARIARLR